MNMNPMRLQKAPWEFIFGVLIFSCPLSDWLLTEREGPLIHSSVHPIFIKYVLGTVADEIDFQNLCCPFMISK